MSNQEQQTKPDGGASVSTAGLGGDVERCHICGEPMTEGESLRQNCGGGCLICMAEAGDPDCIEAAFRLQKAEIARLLAVVDEVHAWAVCGCIATPDDMAKNLPRIVEITTPNVEHNRRPQGVRVDGPVGPLAKE